MTRPPLPEWAPHEAVWIGFPSHAGLWEDDLVPAQQEVAAFAAAVAAEGKGEAVWLVAADDAAAAQARRLVPSAKVIVERFGDIWLRDTAAIVLGSGKDRRGVDFAFNGWGGKYDLPGDDTIGERLAGAAGLPCARSDRVIAGQVIFAAPAVEAEIDAFPLRSAPDHDRGSIAQPDVTERLDDHLGERR